MNAPSSHQRRASAWEWSLAALLGLNLAWTAAGLGGYPAEVRLVTSGLTALLVAVFVLARVFDARAAGRGWHVAGWWPVPFLVYAAINGATVSPVPWLAWTEWLGWLQMAAVFWVVLNGITARGPRRLVFCTLVAVALAGVVLGCYQVFSRPDWAMLGRTRPPEYAARASGSFAIPNSLAGWLLLVLPITGALGFARDRSATVRVWWLWVTAVLLAGLGLTVSRGAWLAAGCACLAWPFLAAGKARGWRRSAAVAVLAAVAVGGGLALAIQQVPGARTRMLGLVSDRGEVSRSILWEAGWKLWQEQPWLGTGGGSFNVAFERHRPERFADTPLYAHNDYLNTLSDYGTVGAVLLFGAVGAMVVGARRARRGRGPTPAAGAVSDSALAGAAGIGLLAFALHLFVEFHLKIPALALALGAIGGLVLRVAWPTEGEAVPQAATRRWARWRAVGAVAMVLGGWGAWMAPTYRAEAIRFEARAALDGLAGEGAEAGRFARVVERAREDLRTAVEIDPTNAAAWADLAFATGLAANVSPDQRGPLGKEAEAQARRALAGSTAPAEHWVRLGTALNLQGDWAGASRAYLQATIVAPREANAWYYYAEHLTRVPAVHEAADAALRVCLRLDPGNRAALALRQRLALAKKTP